MTRIVTVTPISEEEGARLVSRAGARPCVDDRLAAEVRAKIGELRSTAPPEIALGVVGQDEWIAYVMDDAAKGDSGIFLVTLRESSQ